MTEMVDLEVQENSIIEIKEGIVYPSDQNTISVAYDREYGGAHEYYIKDCLGFEKGETVYANSISKISFVKKLKDGTVIPGLQSEQLVLVLLDRVKKLNEVYPDPNNELQIKGLEMFLEACQKRIDDRISRNVMGKLEK